MINIRDARPDDAGELAELNRSFNGVDRDRERIWESLSTPSSSESVVVAEEAGKIVGFLCFQTLRSICYDSPWIEITELFVVPESRRRRVGQALVEEVEMRAERDSASELVVRTHVENAEAQSLCRHIGLDTARHVVFRRRYTSTVH